MSILNFQPRSEIRRPVTRIIDSSLTGAPGLRFGQRGAC